MNKKSNLYILGIVSIVAIVALILFAFTGRDSVSSSRVNIQEDGVGLALAPVAGGDVISTSRPGISYCYDPTGATFFLAAYTGKITLAGNKTVTIPELNMTSETITVRVNNAQSSMARGQIKTISGLTLRLDELFMCNIGCGTYLPGYQEQTNMSVKLLIQNISCYGSSYSLHIGEYDPYAGVTIAGISVENSTIVVIVNGTYKTIRGYYIPTLVNGKTITLLKIAPDYATILVQDDCTSSSYSVVEMRRNSINRTIVVNITTVNKFGHQITLLGGNYDNKDVILRVDNNAKTLGLYHSATINGLEVTSVAFDYYHWDNGLFQGEADAYFSVMRGYPCSIVN